MKSGSNLKIYFFPFFFHIKKISSQQKKTNLCDKMNAKHNKLNWNMFGGMNNRNGRFFSHSLPSGIVSIACKCQIGFPRLL